MARTRPSAPSAPDVLRRRGPALERAILEAAVQQLTEVGWKGFTMEGVAACARTGKAALYRRWRSKEDLAVDALRAGLAGSVEAPDLGSLRKDLLSLCQATLTAMYSPAGVALRAFIHECDHAEAERFTELIDSEVINPGKRLFREVVRRAIDRGEARPEAVDDIVADVVPALMMYRSKMRPGCLTPRDAEEIVDRVMLPLLRVRIL